jgi:transcriptional regulator with XRE-family HTH domain
MVERIKQIIDKKGLQSSSFADKIQVSRGTISHILNGRTINGVKVYNDPSKDTIDKILIAFPDISPSWLLRGEGAMYKSDRISIQPATSSAQPNLFDEISSVESSGKSNTGDYTQKNEVKKPENKTNIPVIQDIKLSNTTSKKIDKIMIFFNDKTYLTFISEE